MSSDDRKRDGVSLASWLSASAEIVAFTEIAGTALRVRVPDVPVWH
jgi:hypothetical protein